MLVAGLLLAACSRTAPIVDDRGRPLAGAIASIEDLTLGGVPQRVWFRGRDRHAPPLVLLHGGPGVPESALFRRFDAALERDFLVVYWEQRGAGRSFRPGMSPRELSTAVLLEDLDALVDAVQRRFGAPRVVLLGHSWGSVLATRYAERYPDKVAACVTVGQVVSIREGDRLGYDWALREAVQRDDQAALEGLRSLGPPPHDLDATLTMDRWLERLGGTLRGGLSTGRLVLAALGTDEATPLDLVRFGQGNRYSLEALWAEYSALDLRDLRRLEVPVFVFAGGHDWKTPTPLARAWFDALQAPLKQWVEFPDAAHHPPYEAPAEFVAAMRERVLPVVAPGPR